MRNGPFAFAHLRLTLVGALLLLLSAGFVEGQSRGGPQNLENREWALTHVGDEINSHFNKTDNTLPPRVREDFQQLQIINNNLMKTVFVEQRLEPAKVLTAVTEIRKRASRLKVDLSLAASGERNIDDNHLHLQDQSALTSSLLSLDKGVMSFVNNPLFQKSKVIDSKMIVKAGDDLTEVVQTATVIADFLSRPGTKN